VPTDQPPERAPDNPALALAVAALSGQRHLRLVTPPPPLRCMGYANCCVCPDCLKRARGDVPKPKRVRQPWEPKP
jgi:hypothetical protein